MNDFVLSCCSTADLTAEHFAARDIHYICFHYSLNGKQYADDLGKSMPFDQFYQAMADGAETQTSQVNVEEFTAYFTPFLEQGKRYSACHAFLGYLGRIQFRLCGAGRTSAKIPGSENLYCRFSGRFVRLRPADGPSGRLKR